MTNLDIIKYLIINNPNRFVKFLEDISCYAWNSSIDTAKKVMDDVNKWLNQESNTDFFSESELKFYERMMKK